MKCHQNIMIYAGFDLKAIFLMRTKRIFPEGKFWKGQFQREWKTPLGFPTSTAGFNISIDV